MSQKHCRFTADTGSDEEGWACGLWEYAEQEYNVECGYRNCRSAPPQVRDPWYIEYQEPANIRWWYAKNGWSGPGKWRKATVDNCPVHNCPRDVGH